MSIVIVVVTRIIISSVSIIASLCFIIITIIIVVAAVAKFTQRHSLEAFAARHQSCALTSSAAIHTCDCLVQGHCQGACSNCQSWVDLSCLFRRAKLGYPLTNYPSTNYRAWSLQIPEIPDGDRYLDGDRYVYYHTLIYIYIYIYMY